ncbi:MAG: DUF2480 family protein [Lewinellaceae bacterium]|nr:DUF2480 family protein [Lewinellaceae bacterium]
MTDKPLINRVANSGLITINLEDYYPKGEVVGLDLKQYLFMELILKEKDFREALKSHDWEQYQGKNLAVYCSTDAIIPRWAYMLVATFASPYANDVLQCTPDQALDQLYLKKMAAAQTPVFGHFRVLPF